jgi:branched-chain amino acid transport system ATP-binding protein
MTPAPASLGILQNPLLQTIDLSVRYGGVFALSGVTMEIAAQEIVAVIGANGAGKSSCLRAISGLVKVASGDVLVRGQSVKGRAAHEIVAAGVAHSPEGRRIFGRLTVADNLALGGYILKSKQEVDRETETVLGIFPRLAERLRQVAGTLSGGEQQMLALARALMSRPQVLLLDEPSLGLAPQVVDEIFIVIQRLREFGRAVLLVEQNATLALEVADRAYVLEAGVMTRTGKARDLLGDDRIREAYLGV